ncbi:hypothetical protein FB451DRAFT_1137944 [Mycena latifolia]|nr:hypothetical protein FB451DRAFT_1137944 [Mycena latifolia]
MASRLPQIRLAVLCTVLLFAIIELGMAGAVTSTIGTYLDVSFSYSGLAIATSVITMATVPVMIALEIIRPGGVTSMIVFELGWLSFLWVLWLATGADAAQATTVLRVLLVCGSEAEAEAESDSIDFGDGVSVPTDDPTAGICPETSAIVAFAFLNWILLLGYTATLLVMSLMATNRKHVGVWQSSVADAPLDATPSSPIPRSYGAQVNGSTVTVKTGTVEV